ncbi:DUF2600 family protein [Aquibacillus halophilus]|uniref:DUF2600 family protein n=1 Tax=Aquibacillus halophilus TaxID=930132 RepID=A0A6A8DJZ2_9BACI|nr:tetraprenyl-beta-curcumene synthase family protein [Aquibacillus halophilus]MRH44796.1 DUF2600 family protein [Aquibacillus halophilus]
MYSIPKTSPMLMGFVYRKIFPQVNVELNYWKDRAEKIPNRELRAQALASLESKRFHCQGGAVYSILAGHRWKEAIRFIIAYQTISDYLDNLCDRSTSLDPNDFSMLHRSMEDALTIGNPTNDYYQYRCEKDDGEYLSDLVKTCQHSLWQITDYQHIEGYLLQLERLYGDLQVHKHVKEDERIPRLEKWYCSYKESWPSLSWYEFSASSGSTLGIFCLVSYGMGQEMTKQLAKRIYESYFPFMQGLHILLDYYIDQQEDRIEGDLNFCNYYNSNDHMKERLLFFIEQANKNVQQLPNKQFHEMVHNGLVGLYLADPKVKGLKSGKEITKTLLQASGFQSSFFHLNIKLYNKLKGRS